MEKVANFVKSYVEPSNGVFITANVKIGNYISFTYSKYVNGEWEAGGHNPDLIVEEFPELAPFIGLHHVNIEELLPMHYISNAVYSHFNFQDKEDYFRIAGCFSRGEWNNMKWEEDNTSLFKYYIHKHKILRRISLKILELISLMNTVLPEEQRIDNSIVPNPEDTLTYKQCLSSFEEVQQDILNGFYSPENIKLRDIERLKEKRKKREKDLEIEFQDNLSTLIKKYSIDKVMISLDIPDKAYIYYPHSDEICFNWNHNLSKEEAQRYLEKFNSVTPLPFSIKNVTLKE